MRKLVASLACRNDGSRLYGKPLQNLNIEDNISILEYLINLIRTLPIIQETVLGVADGAANKVLLNLPKGRVFTI
jgi:spore coat polysaccharide biosynthesis protein SpsF